MKNILHHFAQQFLLTKKTALSNNVTFSLAHAYFYNNKLNIFFKSKQKNNEN